MAFPGFLVGGLGFEPRLAESESAVLPLDDPPSGAPPRVAAGPYRVGSALIEGGGGAVKPESAFLMHMPTSVGRRAFIRRAE